jgi:hypothetical protein
MSAEEVTNVIRAKLAELITDFEDGQKIVSERERLILMDKETLLRIEGAIQICSDLLGDVVQTKSPNGSVSDPALEN